MVGLSCAVVVVVVLTVDVVTPCAPSVEMFFNTQLGRLLLNTHLSRCSMAWVESNRFYKPIGLEYAANCFTIISLLRNRRSKYDDDDDALPAFSLQNYM